MSKRIVYVDGVFDLFHRGHLESLIKAKESLDQPSLLFVGVVSDKDCISYKRKPIISEDDRVEIVRNIKLVDKVIFPCPLIVDMEFIHKHNIDMVVHGFSNEEDRVRQEPFFDELKKNGYFKEIDYYSGISTTDIIKYIKEM